MIKHMLAGAYVACVHMVHRHLVVGCATMHWHICRTMVHHSVYTLRRHLVFGCGTMLGYVYCTALQQIYPCMLLQLKTRRR
jgi:hypothetical protein